MLTIDEFRKLVFESVDLSILSSISRDIPSTRSSLYTELQAARAMNSDGPTPGGGLDTPPSGPGPSPPQTPPQIVNSSRPTLTTTSVLPPSTPPTLSKATVVAKQQTQQTKTEPPSAAATPAAPPATVAKAPGSSSPAQPFIWGDFGSLDVGDYNNSSSSAVGPMSKGGPSRRAPSSSDSADETLGSFGDFAFFVPVGKIEPSEKSKLESSLSRSIARRTSVTVHKVLDELEEHDEEEDEDKNAPGTFSFGDFSLTSNLDTDDGPHNTFRAPPSDAAFMFGDFMVELPNESTSSKSTSKPQQSITPASKSPSTSAALAKSLSLSSHHSLTRPNRVVKRPLISHGGLFRNVSCKNFTGHKSRIRGVVLSVAAENCVISSGGDTGCNMRSSGSTQTLSMYVGHTEVVLHIAVSPDLSLLASSGSDGLLCVFEIATSKRVGDCTHTVPVLCSSFSKNGKYLVSGSQDGICRLWASKKKGQSTPMTSYFGHKALVTCVVFQPNGEMVASGSGDAMLNLWSASTAKVTHMWPKLHASAVMSIGFNGTGNFLLSCDMQRVALSDCASGISLWAIDGPTYRPSVYKFFFTGACFAPQAVYPNYVVISGSDATVSLFEFLLTPRDPSSKQNPALTPKPPPTKKGEKPVAAPVNQSPDVNATLSPEVWSFTARNKVCVMNAGPKHAVVLGDIAGNVTVMTIHPRAGDPLPRKPELKVSLAARGNR